MTPEDLACYFWWTGAISWAGALVLILCAMKIPAAFRPARRVYTSMYFAWIALGLAIMTYVGLNVRTLAAYPLYTQVGLWVGLGIWLPMVLGLGAARAASRSRP